MSMSSASYDELLGRRYNVKATVQSVCFVGDHFWSSLHDGKVIIRDFRTGLQLAMFEPEGREKGITLVTAMGYDSKNNRVWIGSNDGFLSAHDASTVRTDHSTATYQGLIFRSEHRQMNGAVCCIACGKGVVWSSGMRDGKIIEHKVPEDFKSCKNIEITATLIGHQRPPKGLLSTSDRRLWSTWEDGVRVFKAGNEKCLAKINFEGAGERMLQVGTMLWQGGDHKKISMKEWDIERVSSFIKSMGKDMIWSTYADMFKKAKINGTMLLEYQDKDEILDDFKEIDRIHAKFISKAILKAWNSTN
eukprot:CAMPEP_0167741900 /NCGR_PEP_ID=MMETSP0110_2-20121227/1118_1 /TAXON_ID=629695 /ORGANISM="Gymnochlora sp., Strain CCMP2014" /LENGTH=303 /DNA_ID=CAMNT_0007626013 /DNA_START=8 /DNA_END=919 /DNA_ORIENTATION=-